MTDSTLARTLCDLAANTIDIEEARGQVFDAAYAELRRIADSLMRHERANHTLQPTALVNEAYLRLVSEGEGDWRSGAHFFGVAVRAMRQLLVEYARGRNAQKRGGDRQRVSLLSDAAITERPIVDLLALDQALTNLTALDERTARVVELRYFGGLTSDEIAVALNTSRRTVQNDWAFAKRWLHRELQGD